jgi:hypothetical protein
MAPEMLLHVSYAAPQAHGIVNVALQQEYSLGIIFIFSQGKINQGITQVNTTRLYRSYIKKA